MVRVAVAGGTGGVGLHIVEAIVETGLHDVVVLSRKADVPHLTALGVTVHAVSYDDVSSLVRALDGVHTVISTISGIDADSITHPQLALLEAAVKAGVKRFAPSEFASRAIPDNSIDLYKHKWPVAEAVLKRSSSAAPRTGCRLISSSPWPCRAAAPPDGDRDSR